MISLEDFRQKLKTDSFLQEEYKKIVQNKLKTKNLSYPSDKILNYEISNVKFTDEEFARWASNHNRQWSDSNFFVSEDVGVLSNCCFNGDQELYYYDSNGNKYLTTFKNYVEERINKKYFGSQIINSVENEYIDAPDGSKQKIVAVSKLPNTHKKLIEIELEDGRVFKVTPDQKFFDNNTKSLITAKDILSNPEKFDI